MSVCNHHSRNRANLTELGSNRGNMKRICNTCFFSSSCNGYNGSSVNINNGNVNNFEIDVDNDGDFDDGHDQIYSNEELEKYYLNLK
jgi:hypothetical protein